MMKTTDDTPSQHLTLTGHAYNIWKTFTLKYSEHPTPNSEFSVSFQRFGLHTEILQGHTKLLN